MHWFKFDGVASNGRGLIVTSKNAYDGASRDITFTEIPGRNGDLLTDNKRYKNILIEYGVALLADDSSMATLAKNFKAWLLSRQGYLKLSDSYDSDYFRYAAFEGGIGISEDIPSVGFSTATFNCKPFKYSSMGQTEIIQTTAFKISNPEAFPSSPKIVLSASGNITLYIGDYYYYFESLNGETVIDSELMQVYAQNSDGTITNLNNKMHTNIHEAFPTLFSGQNAISWEGSVNYLKLTPRWCTL